MKIRNAGPVLFLVVFGSAFSLLGVLTLSIVLSGIHGREREQLLFSNVVPLAGAALFLAAAAAIFGSALRLPFARHPLGDPELAVTPSPAQPGARLSIALRIVPVAPVTLQEVSARVVCVEVRTRGAGWTRKTTRAVLHDVRADLALPPDGRVPAGGAETLLSGVVELPHDAPRTKVESELFRGWSVRLVIVTGEGPDWVHEQALLVEG